MSDAADKPEDGALDERFLEAWINTEHTVCGIRLRPYCFNSALMLEVVRNPLGMADLPEGFPLTWERLWEAATICALDYEQPFKAPSAFRCQLVQAWRRMNLATELAKFRAYQNDFYAAPDIFCTSGDGRTLTAPGILARAVSLMREIGLPEKRVWMMPIGKALWMHAANAEMTRDGVALVGEEEGQLMQLIRRIQDGELGEDALPPERMPAKPERIPADQLVGIFGTE